MDGEMIVKKVGNLTGGDVFTEEALKSQNGKTVPFRLTPEGPVIGEATMHYDAGEKALKANFRIEDPEVAEFFRDNTPPHIRKES